MFLLNLKLFIRNIKKHKGTFLINIIGLSAGLTCTLLIYMWLSDELSIDKFHEKDSQLFQLMSHIHKPHGIGTAGRTSLLLADALKSEFPEIEESTYVIDYYFTKGNIVHKDKTIRANRLLANERFFNVFSYQLIHGKPAEVLSSKDKVVISDDLANKLFSSAEDAIGKLVTWNNAEFSGDFMVSGIFMKVPENSTQQFDAVFQSALLVDIDPPASQWNSSSAKNYLILKEGIDSQNFSGKIESFLASKYDKGKNWKLFVQKYSDRYLYDKYENGMLVGGRIQYIRYFSLIAIFILIIACVNFINLSTAQASNRMKAIGVKKAIGLSRKLLVIKFLGETTLTVFLALGFAIVLAFALLPQFNEITGKNLQFLINTDLFIYMLIIGILTSILAGTYPALYLSGFSPIKVLKGELHGSLGENRLRKGLVVFQFALSAVLILGVLVVDQQLRYTQTKNMGYNRDQVISFQRPGNNNDLEIFLTSLKNIPEVMNASNIGGSIMSGWDRQGGYSWSGENSEREFVFLSPQVGYDVIETLNIEILEGRSFSRTHRDDESKIVVNQSAQKIMQMDNLVGKFIKYGDQRVQVIGIVDDFHYGSLHQEVKPLIFRFRTWGRNIMVKLQTGTEKHALSKIEKIYKRFHPDHVFEFSFLDEENYRLYQNERRVAILSKYFAILAILISCLGLLGLAAFTIDRRKKEIGIRKALGQTAAQVSLLLTKEFTFLVLIALAFGLPIGFILTRNWLSTFAYKIDLHTGYFLMVGVLVLMIALLTVSSQAIRAARRNPIEALREE